jgi:hypothetical protein
MVAEIISVHLKKKKKAIIEKILPRMTCLPEFHFFFFKNKHPKSKLEKMRSCRNFLLDFGTSGNIYI